MDVFIPEEYVIRRRMEKKAAALAGKRTPNMVAETEASKKWRTSRSCHRHFGLTATSCWWVVGSVKLWFSVAYLPNLTA
ncbi:putative LRR receptor-like serine/threonine-protein kinase [Gossypium australe]|uniref:Putative LRR receptor-like serine/threonine-protein kinase n=1 Tax=Gossypium australe TaxID=47621 RepID=A0A5B6UEV2_9ROSI|nr:putative LRR receptor-like serine/threonine-protein kinase [Gossypium australe]